DDHQGPSPRRPTHLTAASTTRLHPCWRRSLTPVSGEGTAPHPFTGCFHRESRHPQAIYQGISPVWPVEPRKQVGGYLSTRTSRPITAGRARPPGAFDPTRTVRRSPPCPSPSSPPRPA